MPEVTALTGMGVQSADNDGRALNAKSRLQVPVQDAGDINEPLSRNGIGHIAQRQMRGCKRYTKGSGGQQHYRKIGICEFREEFRMTRKRDVRIIYDAFLHRSGDQGGKLTRHATFGGASKTFEDLRGIRRIQPAAFDRLRERYWQDSECPTLSRVASVVLGNRNVAADRGRSRVKDCRIGNENYSFCEISLSKRETQVWTDTGGFAGS